MAKKKNLSALVDRLAELNAEIRELEDEAREIKDALINSGKEVIESELFRAKIAFVESKSLDRKAVEKILSPAAFESVLKVSSYARVVVSDR